LLRLRLPGRERDIQRDVPVKRLASLFAASLLASMLAACAGNDDATARFLVAPGKYALFNCKQLAEQTEVNLKRQHELEGLMAQAGEGTGGQMVSTVAYRPEYLTLRGEMTDLRETAVDKKCNFVPGENPAGRTMSGNAIR
jgi:hypothetical protein